MRVMAGFRIAVALALMRASALALAFPLLGVACGGGAVIKEKGPLLINEVMAADEGGTAIDEGGRIGDWIELLNRGTSAVDLSTYTLSDTEHTEAPLPAGMLSPGATILLWADGDATRGPAHLGFKISAKGERLILRDAHGALADEVVLPAMNVNEAFARIPDGSDDWTRCRYATPARSNGQRCGPSPPPDTAGQSPLLVVHVARRFARPRAAGDQRGGAVPGAVHRGDEHLVGGGDLG